MSAPEPPPLPKIWLLRAFMEDFARFGTVGCPIDEEPFAYLYQVSPRTVRREMCALERRGLVIRRAGKFYPLGLGLVR